MKKIGIGIIAILGMALSAHAATRQWGNTGTGEFTNALNWAVAAPTSADIASITNNGTATFSAGQSYTVGGLNIAVPPVGKPGSGTVSMSGGSLSVTGLTVVGYNGTGTGTLNMTGTSKLTSGGNLQVGNAAAGVLNVGSTATGSCAFLIIGITDTGFGTANLAGTWDASMVLLGNNAAAVNGSGTLNLTNNFKLTASSDLRAVVGKNQQNLNVYGSGGLFSVGGNFAFTNSKASLSFIADAAGFTTINVASNINIAGTKLNINLSAYTGTVSSIVLMNGASLSNTFASVNITGGTGNESVVYDTVNGNLMLIPEPATIGMMGFAGVMIVLIRRHLRR